MEVLKEKAAEIEAVIREVPGAADVQKDQVTGTPQLRIRIDRKAIARYGINVEDVQNVIRTAVGGESAGQLFEGIRRFDIFVRFTEEARDRAEVIQHILIAAPGGAKVPLDQLASIEEIVGPRQITRENNQRFITVQTNVRGRDIGSFVAEGQQAIAAKVQMPPGYLISWGGQFELQQQANQRLALVVPVTLLIILFLLFMNFSSLKNTFLILLNIPLADRSEPLGPLLHRLHRPVRHRSGERHGAGHLPQPAAARRGGYRSGLDKRGLSAPAPGADDRHHHRPGADPPAYFQRHRQRSTAPPGHGGGRRPGHLDHPHPAGHSSPL
jgi:hypothetical protein